MARRRVTSFLCYGVQVGITKFLLHVHRLYQQQQQYSSSEYSSSFLIAFFLSFPPLIHSNQDFACEEAKEKFDFGRRRMMAHVVVVVYSDEH